MTDEDAIRRGLLPGTVASSLALLMFAKLLEKGILTAAEAEEMLNTVQLAQPDAGSIIAPLRTILRNLDKLQR